MQPNLIDHPDLFLPDLIDRANRLCDTLIRCLPALECLEMQSELQWVLGMKHEGSQRLGLISWLINWKQSK